MIDKNGFVNKDGYRIITVSGKQVCEHRWVMAQHLGRELTRKEIVHHIDEDKLNNSIDNLHLCANHAEHNRLHATYRTEDVKQCPKCGETKSRAEFYTKDIEGTDPNKAWCKTCCAEYNRKYYEANKDYHRKYYEDNKDHYRKYREANHEQILNKKRLHYQANREAIKESQRKYREDNREQLSKKASKYYQANREAIKDYYSKYYQANREALKEYQRKYREAKKAAKLARAAS